MAPSANTINGSNPPNSTPSQQTAGGSSGTPMKGFSSNNNATPSSSTPTASSWWNPFRTALTNPSVAPNSSTPTPSPAATSTPLMSAVQGNLSSPPPPVTTQFGYNYQPLLNSTADAAAAGAIPPPIAVLPSYVLPDPPLPPNFVHELNLWSKNPSSAYHLVEVANNCEEYQAIQRLFNSDSGSIMTGLAKVYNSNLFRKFTSNRKESLLAKSDDRFLLQALGVSEEEAKTKWEQCTQFGRSKEVESSLYSDNTVLAFHGLRDSSSLSAILTGGLDERLGNGAGLLGRGLYFSDSPEKAEHYAQGGRMLLSLVTAGDCVTIAGSHRGAVRPPQKTRNQQRNAADTSFDSVIGRPTGLHNELVIYDGNQTYPLYVITFLPKNTATADGGSQFGAAPKPDPTCSAARLFEPTFTWSNPRTADETAFGLYPLMAASVFGQMLSDPSARVRPAASESPSTPSGQQQIDMAIKLSQLHEFGFLDDEKNRELLLKNDLNFDRTLNQLVEFPKTGPQALPAQGRKRTDSTTSADTEKRSKFPSGTSSSGQNVQKTVATASGPAQPSPVDEACIICTDRYPFPGPDWLVLPCTHKLCLDCAKQITNTGSTMSGVSHTSIKCAEYNNISGVLVGSCPNGIMSSRHNPESADGFEKHGSISIKYSFANAPHFLSRTAYLPDTTEGRRILKLFEVAFDRRLTFEIGTSLTTGTTNTLVWNIHHKTALSGGPFAHGYPDLLVTWTE